MHAVYCSCCSRKELFTSVHYFVHLNLSIALMLGYILFVAGVDTAVAIRVRGDKGIWKSSIGAVEHIHCVAKGYIEKKIYFYV